MRIPMCLDHLRFTNYRQNAMEEHLSWIAAKGIVGGVGGDGCRFHGRLMDRQLQAHLMRSAVVSVSLAITRA